jgi:enterochelin esterase-like enzyme
MSLLVARRRLVRVLAAAWIALGLIGLYSYLDNYWVTRGFAAVVRDRGVRPGRLQWVHFYSPALHRQADYLVYLPTGYDPARRYPVFYLLHGMPGRPTAYIGIVHIDARLDNLIRAGDVPPMILVFPDGRIDGDVFSDSEWANTSAGRYEDYLLDVVRDVDRRFPTIANRDARVIAGYSAGALGALNVTLHHLQVFASFEAWSGPFAEDRSGVFAHATRAEVAHYSPLEYVPGLVSEFIRYPVQGFLYGGRSDFDSRHLPEMGAELAAAGAAVQWTFYPGGHDFQLWNGHVNQMLILAGRYLTTPPPPDHPRHSRARLRATRHHRHAAHHISPRPRNPGTRHRATAAAGQKPSPATTTTAVPLPTAAGLVAVAGLAEGGALGLTVGLILALVSAAAINLGFLLQQRGLVRDAARARGMKELVRTALRSPTWLAGQSLGWLGFAVQILAVAVAPLSVVQAFAAGGLALSVPLAAAFFGHRVTRRQTVAVLLTAAGLASLPLGLSNAKDHLETGALIACSAGAAAAAAILCILRAPAIRAIAAGIFYGVADAAIKAVSVTWGPHGAGALVSGWTLVALLGTLGGFLAFQASLRDGDAITEISLMNALAAVTALASALLAFGESLGGSGTVVAWHAVAITLVLGCIPPLATAQVEMAAPTSRRHPHLAGTFGFAMPPSLASAARAAAHALLAAVAVVAAVLAGVGWLYALRGFGWFAVGTHIGDALPLLQLAGTDAQPLLRIALAWIGAGLVAGLALRRVARPWRVLIAGGAALIILLLAAQASYALARNLNFAHILWSRSPGLGPWVEAVLFAASSCLPARSRASDRGATALAMEQVSAIRSMQALARGPQVGEAMPAPAPTKRRQPAATAH